MSAPGGFGQQVAGDLFEIGKSAVKGTAKVLGDTLGDSIEQILGAPVGVNIKKDGELGNNPESDIEHKKLMKRRDEKRQFQEVKTELAQYLERKQQRDEQIKREKDEEKQKQKQEDSYKKQKKESFLQGLMKRLAGGSHGETDRQKE